MQTLYNQNSCQNSDLINFIVPKILFPSLFSVRQILIILLIGFFPLLIKSQDLYNYKNSLIYSNFLMGTKQYKLASEEFERILFMKPDNDTIKNQLLRSYLFDKQYEKVQQRSDNLFNDKASIPRLAALVYSRSLVLTENYTLFQFFIEVNRNLTDFDRKTLMLNSQLLKYDWKNAELTFKGMMEAGYSVEKKHEALFLEIKSVRYKSPVVAVGMSALIPGSGKANTGEWKDGLVSLLFVAGSAIQAYRGYTIYGEKSAFFIVYTGLATTFYLSNLYGSYKSAKKYNEKIRQNIHHRAENIFISTF
ncbi:MAG: hypothetical protein CVT92_14060 [Bacteroidetes bacterium HGW-Bacteroidetes-1]|jgi:hypothetical protein|nr:MAG: hypothetical protein CVT92_14060 [Bacteroidetes bacterium HGW-Bacteroidetes-1]